MIGSDIGAQVRSLRDSYPDIYSCLDLERVAEQCGKNSGPATSFDEFGADGRGGSYIVAQQSAGARASGIRRLVDIFTQHCRAESRILIDLLGGDGLVSRVVSTFGPDRPLIVTCDASPFMVQAAWARDIPALLQRAEESIFRNESVGGVLLAYGTHHIPPADRQTVVAEAFRILQPGGVLVMHDFLEGSAMGSWFAKVVDAYSVTGHDHSHFASHEIDAHLHAAGFTEVTQLLIDDPFTAQATSREQAELNLGRYLFHMYGLVRLIDEAGTRTPYRRVFELAADIFQYEKPDGTACAMLAEYDRSRSMWSVTMPREAIVGFGRKP